MAAPDHKADAAQMRLIGIVMAVAMIGWMAFQWLGGQYGWALRWAFLADMMALGAFVWSLLVTWRIWRRRNG